MLTTTNGLEAQANTKGPLPTRTMRAAAVIGTLIFVSLAVNALIIVAGANLRQPSWIAEFAR